MVVVVLKGRYHKTAKKSPCPKKRLSLNKTRHFMACLLDLRACRREDDEKEKCCGRGKTKPLKERHPPPSSFPGRITALGIQQSRGYVHVPCIVKPAGLVVKKAYVLRVFSVLNVHRYKKTVANNHKFL